MNALTYLMAALIMLSVSACNAQIKNSKSETTIVYGNCEICKKSIEHAGNVNRVASVNWDENTKQLVLSYDSTKTTSNEILKRIALAGYDNAQYIAPDEAYNKLPECCRYKRPNKKTVVTKTEKESQAHHQEKVSLDSVQPDNSLQSIVDQYFLLKNALTQSDGRVASNQAKELSSIIQSIKMSDLSEEQHKVWMKIRQPISFDAEHIAETEDLTHQRDHFSSLSKNMLELVKVTKDQTPVYYQQCPMFNDGKGAYWLSRETTIKNPYYGTEMLNCGKTVETIK